MITDQSSPKYVYFNSEVKIAQILVNCSCLGLYANLLLGSVASLSMTLWLAKFYALV